MSAHRRAGGCCCTIPDEGCPPNQPCWLANPGDYAPCCGTRSGPPDCIPCGGESGGDPCDYPSGETMGSYQKTFSWWRNYTPTGYIDSDLRNMPYSDTHGWESYNPDPPPEDRYRVWVWDPMPNNISMTLPFRQSGLGGTGHLGLYPFIQERDITQGGPGTRTWLNPGSVWYAGASGPPDFPLLYREYQGGTWYCGDAVTNVSFSGTLKRMLKCSPPWTQLPNPCYPLEDDGMTVEVEGISGGLQYFCLNPGCEEGAGYYFVFALWARHPYGVDTWSRVYRGYAFAFACAPGEVGGDPDHPCCQVCPEGLTYCAGGWRPPAYETSVGSCCGVSYEVCAIMQKHGTIGCCKSCDCSWSYTGTPGQVGECNCMSQCWLDGLTGSKCYDFGGSVE